VIKMLLKKLLKKVNVEKIIGNKNIKINDIKYDSRQIKDGDLFYHINYKELEKGCRSLGKENINKLINKAVIYSVRRLY
jgi:heme oxygenase